MNDQHKIFWDEIALHQKEIDILKFKMGRLEISEQVEILKYAFSIGDDRGVFDHLLKTEPINYRKSNRNLTKGLFNIILSTALYPGNNELDAIALISALVIDFPNYRNKIDLIFHTFLEEADKTCDYEVYERVCNLLIDIKSDQLDLFLKRCREHECSEIREIDEDWDTY